MPSFLSPPLAFGIFTVRTGGGKLAAAATRKKQQAEEIKEAERVRREAIADAEWNARFV